LPHLVSINGKNVTSAERLMARHNQQQVSHPTQRHNKPQEQTTIVVRKLAARGEEEAQTANAKATSLLDCAEDEDASIEVSLNNNNEEKKEGQPSYCSRNNSAAEMVGYRSTRRPCKGHLRQRRFRGRE
jgi:hypothetical protein